MSIRGSTLVIFVCGLVVTRNAAAQSSSAALPPTAPADTQAIAAPPAPATPGPSQGGSSAGPSDWKFDYHGYIRAPLRLGFGHNDGCKTCNPVQTGRPAGQSATSIHSPLIPDGQYLSWQYTTVQSPDWAELFFSYGNSVVKGTVGLQGYDFTDASFAQAATQFGIAQGWVTLTPNIGYQNVHLEANAGAFWSRYGVSGKYDTGAYGTYLFGRTHQIGETAKLSIDVGKATLFVEEGFGVKKPDPNMYNPAKFSLLAHGHAGIDYNRFVSFNVHFLYAWSQEEDSPANSMSTTNPFLGLPSGNMMIFGPELAIRNTPFGELYVGFSRIQANHATVVDDVVEVLHSGGGSEFAQGIQGNYLDGTNRAIGTSNCARPGATSVIPCAGASQGTGSVNTLLLQYDFSLAGLLAGMKHESYWGDGPNLAASFFMMYNAVSSDDKGTTSDDKSRDLAHKDGMDGVKKIKYGVDILGTPLKWLGIGLRADRVQPNSYIPQQSFSILSPRLVLRTAFVTHEEFMIQYSRYFYANRQPFLPGATPASGSCLDQAGAVQTGLAAISCALPPTAPSLPNGYGVPPGSNAMNQRGAPNLSPDLNVMKIQATMWW